MENLLAFALAALIVMSTSWFQHVLERRVVRNLADLTGGRVEISSFRFKPWLFQITLQKLVIHGLEPAGAAPLFSAREIEAGVSPRQLLHRRLRLRYLDIDGLQVHVRTNPRGVTNLPGPADQPSPEERLKDLMDLSIGRLTISHSAFFWNDQRQPVEINAQELAILLRMTAGRYSGTVSSTATIMHSARWSPGPVNFNGRFELTSAKLVFSPLAWEAQGASGDASFTILLRPDLQATGSYHASMELSALARILAAPEVRGGTLQFEGTAVYQGGSLSAQGRAQARQAAILTPAFPPLRLDATTSYGLDQNQLNLTNLVVSVWGGTVQGTLLANFQDSAPKFRLNSHLQQVRLENLLRAREAPALIATYLHPASVASGALSASWSGRWQGLEADFDLSLQGPAAALPEALPVSGTARGTINGGSGLTLHFADAEFQTPHSTITAHGTIAQNAAKLAAPDPLALTVTTNDFDEWRPFFQALVDTASGIPLKLKSPAEFSGQLTGSVAEPFLQGQVKLGQFQYRDWTWDGLAATVALSPNLVQITGGRVEHAKSSFELNASAQLNNWRLTPASAIHVSAHAQQTAIEGLKAAVNLDVPLRGSVSGRVEVEGTMAEMAGAGVVRIDEGAFADEPFDSFSAPIRVARSVWKLEKVELRKKQGRLVGDITIEPRRRFAAGRLQGADFRLADMRHLPMTAATWAHKGGLDGGLNFEAHGQGTPEDFHLQSTWRLLNASVSGAALGDFHGTLTGDGRQLTLQGEGQSPGGNLHFLARTTAQDAWPMEAEGEYSGVRVDPWIRAFFNREFGAAVTLAGSFHSAGPLRSPEKIELQSRASEVAVDFPSVQWRNAQPVEVHYSEGKLALSRFVMSGPSTELNIEGTIGFTSGVALSLTADGSANASLLTVFDSNLQATGRSALRVRLTGTPERPLLNGVIDIQDMSLGYNELPLRLNNLQGTINLESERALINSLRGTCGGGTVKLGGFVTLAASPRFEVRADLAQVRVRYPSSFTSVLDGNLRLGGGVDQAQLQGDLVVRQMVVNENINIISKIIESSNALLEQPPTVASPVAAKIRMNIRVNSTPPVLLQTPNLRLVGDIDLRLQGTVANPVQVGSIHFLSGETVFRGNRYTLARGDITMANPFHTQASLDLEAQTRVQSYDLTLDITGPFDRLKFSYRSDPPLAQTDIVSLLALGYVPQEQVFPALQGNPSTSVGASAILSQALSSQIGGRIQRLLGVSRIKIDPYVGMPGLGSGERVTVEEQVTHDLTLTYITDTSYSQYTIVQFEWNVSANMSILGVRDPNGVFGIEFRFRRRFK